MKLTKQEKASIIQDISEHFDKDMYTFTLLVGGLTVTVSPTGNPKLPEDPIAFDVDAYAQPDGGTVNGEDDPSDPTEENPPRMPFLVPSEKRPGEWRWRPMIDVEEGRILDWPKGTEATAYYKPSDDCAIKIRGKDWNEGEYVPDFMCPQDEGYGDYIIMRIDGEGKIAGWKPADFRKWFKDRQKKGGEA